MPVRPLVVAPRRGRPRKFGGPSRAVTLTLPENVIRALSGLDRDLSRAVVRLTQPELAKRPHPPAELATFGRRAVIVVSPTRTLWANGLASPRSCRTRESASRPTNRTFDMSSPDDHQRRILHGGPWVAAERARRQVESIGMSTNSADFITDPFRVDVRSRGTTGHLPTRSRSARCTEAPMT